MALLGQFQQVENKTGSFDETAGYRSCRSPLEQCSMWSLRVTNVAQQVRRRSGWRVARGVDQKCQKTENNVKFLVPDTAKLKHLQADSATGSWTPVWPLKTSRATTGRHMVTRDPVSEVQFRDEEADKRIVLYARLARGNDSVMHSYTLTLRLMS